MDVETIKEYLVSLGFDVDSRSLNQAKQSLGVANGLFNMFGGNVGKSMSLAAAGVIGFFASVTTATVGFIGNLAKADLEQEKFARRMNMSKDAAYAFNTALEAMGVSQEDLWLSPELAAQFAQLRREVEQLRPPEDFGYAMRQVREIGFEVSRLKATFSSATQWIGHYLYVYLEKPLQTAKTTLKSWNESLKKTMPEWTKNAAQVLSWFVRLGAAGIRGVQELSGAVFGFLGKLPREVQVTIAAIAAAGMLLNANPITLWMMAIAAALLLLEDYYTYIEGGESAFGSFWASVDETKERFDSFMESLNIGELFNGLGEQFGALGGTLKGAGSEVLAFFDNLSKNETAVRTFETGLQGVAAVLESIVSAVRYLTGGVGNLFEGFNDMLTGKKSVWEVLGTWKDQLLGAREDLQDHVSMRIEGMRDGIDYVLHDGDETAPSGRSSGGRGFTSSSTAPATQTPQSAPASQKAAPQTVRSPIFSEFLQYSQALQAKAAEAGRSMNGVQKALPAMITGSTSTTEIKNSGNMTNTFHITGTNAEEIGRTTAQQVGQLDRVRQRSRLRGARGVIG